MQQIYIIGAGAIGKALAVFLNAENKLAILVRGSVDNVPDETVTLEVVLGDGNTVTAQVDITTFNNLPQLNGIIVLTNKSFGNIQIANALKEKAGSSPIIVMQNGLNIEQPFLENNFSNVYRCVLFATSQVMTEKTVRFKPVSISPIGAITENDTQLQSIVAALSNAQFKFQSVTEIQPIVWKKVIANCVFNSICPLLDVDNGIFFRDETVRSMANEVINECVAVAKEAGVILGADDVLETVLLISKSSDGQLISTLQDIRNKRPTEIDSLNFAIVKTATQLGMVHLAPKTKLLGELTKAKSALSLQQS